MKSGQLPDGLITQLVEHCIDVCKGHGFPSSLGPSRFQFLISQLLKLCVYNCDDLWGGMDWIGFQIDGFGHKSARIVDFLCFIKRIRGF